MDLVRREELRRWEPTSEFDRMSRRLTQRFRKILSVSNTALTDFRPRVDIDETDTAYQIRADLPAVRREDVRVTRDDGMLTIEGSRSQESVTNGRKQHRVECSYGRFMRRFSLPKDADANAIEADLTDGVLKITVPKTGARSPGARQIEVR